MEWKKALAAFQAGQFQTAIQICETALMKAPENYELCFLLARAYGASGQYKKALSRAETLLAKNPQNTDVLLLVARLWMWQGNLPAAKEGFQSVIQISPMNIEGKIGLADVALAQGKPDRALEFCQDVLRTVRPTVEIYYCMGRAYRLQGKIRKAKFNFGEAVRLDPANADYRRAFDQTDPGLQTKAEFRYLLRAERFSGSAADYAIHQLAIQFLAPGNIGPVVLKINLTRRDSQGDIQYGGEIYPRLWRRAYGYVDLSITPDAVYFPRLSSRFEVYQGAFDAAEFSLGYWCLEFPSERVNIYLGSAAYYLGSYYAVLRLTHNPTGGQTKTSWMAQIRHYFSDIDYVYIGYGRGERPFEIGTVEDLIVHRSWALVAGAKWYFWRAWKLEFNAGRVADNSGLSRDTITVSTGYRW
jgi:YaiO family outer membrane protein